MQGGQPKLQLTASLLKRGVCSTPAPCSNNLANLLRKPAMARQRSSSGKVVVSKKHLDMHQFCEALYRRSLAIRESCFGSDSPQLAASCSNLAVLLQHTEPKLPQHVDEAERLLNRGLAIRRAVRAPQLSDPRHDARVSHSSRPMPSADAHYWRP